MQLIGWIELVFRLGSIQPIFLLSVHDYTSKYILQSAFLILHSLRVLLHNTFLALRCQRNSPSRHCLRRLLYVTCFGTLYFFLMSYYPIDCAGNVSLGRNGWWCDRLHVPLLSLLFLLKVL